MKFDWLLETWLLDSKGFNYIHPMGFWSRRSPRMLTILCCICSNWIPQWGFGVRPHVETSRAKIRPRRIRVWCTLQWWHLHVHGRQNSTYGFAVEVSVIVITTPGFWGFPTFSKVAWTSAWGANRPPVVVCMLQCEIAKAATLRRPLALASDYF